MKTHHLCLSGILLFLLTCIIKEKSYAQSDSVLRLDEYELSVSRTGGSLKKTFKNVTVLESSEIIKIPAQTIEDVLLYVAGVDVRKRSPFGVQSDISVRGGSFEQTLILLNGVKINDPQTGHHNMNLPISLDAIERIEILKGPGARIYGQNAFTGAINIITKTEDTVKASLTLTAGQFSYLNTTASVSLPWGNYRQSIHFSRKSADGYMLNTDFTDHRLYYQSRPAKDVEFVAGFQQKSFGANGFYSNLFPWQWEKTRTFFINTKAKKGGKIVVEPSFYYRYHDDEFLLKRDTPSFYKNDHLTHIYGFEICASFNSRLGKSSFGYENRAEQIRSGSLGNHSLLQFNLFAEHKILLKRWIITPGFMTGYAQEYGLQFFPGIDIGYEISNSASIYAGTGRTFRNPTFTELYYSSPANKGNPLLQPEKAWSTELGYRKTLSMWQMDFCLFSRQATNLIDWTRESDTQAWKAENLTSINTIGTEADIRLNLRGLIKKQTFLNFISLSYAYNQSDQLPNDYLSKNILDFMQNQFIARIDYSFGKKIRQVLTYRLEDKINLPPIHLIDSRLIFQLRHISFVADVTNILNVEYYEFGSIRMPGRWFRLGFNISLEPST